MSTSVRSSRERDLLRWDRAAAQRLCDLAQFGVLILLFVLYLAAPKPVDVSVSASLVPLVLAIFIVVTAARMAASLKGITARWLPYLWVGLDFGCLFALLASYGLQYEGGPQLALKATTADMLYFLIAVRAVLHDMRILLAALAAALIGWVGLTIFAIYGSGAEPAITRSFVSYMSSEGVLIGAQVERMLGLILVTFVLGIGIWHSRRDALTGLGNRHALLLRLEQNSRQASRTGVSALYLIEIENLHSIANSFGEELADSALRLTARRLGEFADTRGESHRIGPATFAITFTNASNAADVERTAARLERVIAEPAVIGVHHVTVRASVGATIAAHHTSPVSVLSDATIALARARAQGGARAVMFRPDIRAEAADRLAIEMELRGAELRGEIELFYQPVVRLTDGTILGAEALMRWRSPTRGLISPAVFIPIAEETGLIIRLGAWAIRQAAADQRAWRAAGAARSAFVSVNVSNVQLQQWTALADAAEEAAASGASLKLEVTESAMAGDPQTTAERLRHLSELGIALAIDDFGTGYSSYGQLHALPFDTLKIDRSFVARAAEEAGRATLAAIGGLARALDLAVIIEGVETETERAVLLALGFREAQGFLFARPEPQRSFLARLARDIAAQEAVEDEAAHEIDSRERAGIPAEAAARAKRWRG